MTHKLTRLLALMLAVVMTVSMLLVPVEAASFTDVKDGSWYASAVEYVNDRGWMAGVSETSFAPNAEVTRGMMVTVLARLADARTSNDKVIFTDTAAGKWYTGAASWASEYHIASGVGGGRFSPNRAVTRQDLCVMLYAYIKEMDIELDDVLDHTFADMGSVADYAREAVIYCAGTGLISGFEDGTFRSKSTATRAQLAQILMRMDKLIKGEETVVTPKPAQSFYGEAGEELSVSVDAPEGALPENSDMTVTRVTDETTLRGITARVDGELLAAADITFSNEGTELEPEKAVEVRLGLDGLENVENPIVVHVRPNGSVEIVSSELVNANRAGTKKELRFSAKDFSIYAVIDGEGDEARLQVVFHLPVFAADGTFSFTGTGEDYEQIYYVTKQDVINNDNVPDGVDPSTVAEEERHINYLDTIIPDPTVTMPEENPPKFFGWTTDQETECRDGAYTDADASILADGTHDINAVRETVKEFLENNTISDLDDDQTIHVYPVLYHFYTVSYKDEFGNATLDTLPVYSRTPSVLVPISFNYDPQTVGATFDSWLNTKNGATIQNDTNATISENLVLRAKMKEGCYIIFDEQPGNKDRYKGATYAAPIWCPNGVVPTEELPEDSEMKLKGYTFDGWYLKSNYEEKDDLDDEEANAWSGSRYVFPDHYDRVDGKFQNVELVAKWKYGPTTYLIQIMVQDATNVPGGAKTYSVYKTLQGDATSRSEVSSADFTQYTVPENVLDADLGSYLYFNYVGTYNEEGTTDPQQIAPNGSTQFQVRFDRETITYNFYARFSVSFTASTFADDDLPYTDSVSQTGSYCYYNTNMQHWGSTDGGNTFFPLTLEPSQSSYEDANGNIRYDRCVWKNKETGATYTANHNYAGSSGGTRYYYPDTNIYIPVSTSGNKGTKRGDCSGLYGADLAEGEWWHICDENERWYSLNPSTNKEEYTQYRGTYTSNATTKTTTIDFWLKWYRVSTDTRTVRYHYENIGGGYPAEPSTQEVEYRTAALIPRTRTGFELIQVVTNGVTTAIGPRQNVDASDRVQMWYSPNTSHNNAAGGEYLIGESGADLYYKRNQHTLKFYVNGDEVTDKTNTGVYYYEPLADYYFEPTGGSDLYYYSGTWYTNEACTDAFDLSTAYMPDQDLTLYTKLEIRRVRVFLHTGLKEFEDTEVNYDWPKINGTYAITWVDRDQSKNFQVDYGQAISGGQPILGTAKIDAETIYVVMGWYTDPEYNHPFIFSNTYLTEDTTLSYDKDDPANVTNGPDDKHDEAWNKDKEEGRVWVNRDLHLYAKWRQLLPGANGIRLQYVGDEAATTDGVNGNAQHNWYDLELYGDGANAIADTASTPLNVLNNVATEKEYLFSYWRLQQFVRFEGEGDNRIEIWEDVTDPEDEEVGVFYPGTPLQVAVSYAKKETLSGDQHTHLPVHVNAVEANCISDGHGEWYWCSVCSKYYPTEACTAGTEFTPAITPATGVHTYADAYEADGANGHYRVCTVCGAHETEQPVAHTYTSVVTAPTVTEQGYTTYTCSLCGYSYVGDYTEPLGDKVTVTYHTPTGVTAPAAQEVDRGSNVTLPTVGAPSGYTFLGWLKAELSDTTNKPGTIYETAATVNEDTDFYALYRNRVQTSNNLVYELVQETPSDWSGVYVITYGQITSEIYVLKGLSHSGSTGTSYESSSNGSSVSYADSGMTLNGYVLSGVGNAYLFTVAASGSYYTIRSNAQSTYLRIYNNYLRTGNSASETYAKWTIALEEDNFVLLTNANGGDYPYMAFSTSDYFMAAKNGSHSIAFWKQMYEGEYHYTTSPASGSVVPGPEQNGSNNRNARPTPDPVTATSNLLNEQFSNGSISAATSSYATSGWSAYNAGSGNNWTLNTNSSYTHSGSYSAQYQYNSSSSANCYLISQSFSISSAASAVNLSLYQAVDYSRYPERFEVFLVKASDASTVTAIPTATHYQLLASQTYTNQDWAERTGSLNAAGLTALAGQSVRLVLHCTSDADMDFLFIDDIVVTQTTSENVSITFNANASEFTGTMPPQSVTPGSAATLNTNNFSRDGYNFAGWNTAADGTGTAYADAGSVTTTAALTLYAQWSKIASASETVTYVLANSLTAGEDYVIVINNYAAGNTTPSGYSHYLTGQSVTDNGDNTITLSSTEGGVLWHVTGTTSGWSFYNRSVNGFLGLDSGYYLNLTNSSWAWTYNGTDLDNQCSEQDNNYSGSQYYYYLTLKSSSPANAFSTSYATGQNVKFYKRVLTETTPHYTVTAQVNNSGYGSVSPASASVEEGQSKTFRVTLNNSGSNTYGIASATLSPASAGTVTITRETNDVTVSNVTAACQLSIVLDYQYTVTFQDDDGTVLKTEQVIKGNAATAPFEPYHAGYRFTGWSPADFTNVQSNMTIVATYEATTDYQVIFRDSEGNTLSSTTVPRTGTHYVTPPAAPAIEGYTFAGWSTEGVVQDVYSYAITKDTVFIAIYTENAEETIEYTVRLRAVYTDKVPPKTTHVTWYANNGELNDDGSIKSLNSELVPINSNIIIQGEIFSNPGYTFLGWARMDEEDTNDLIESADSKSYAIPADDLWLVYHPAEGETAAHYTVRDPGKEERDVEYIAANERMPYHGLYAVWQRDTFYVLHSSTGVIEAVSMPVNVSTDSTTGTTSQAIGTVDLTDYVREGYFYGGYYTRQAADADAYVYGFVEHSTVQGMADAYAANASDEAWHSADASLSGISQHVTLATATVSGFTAYDGSCLYTNGTDKPYEKVNNQIVYENGSPKLSPAVWDKNAAGTASGESLQPESGKVYYLKEVPSYFLSSKVLYTYDVYDRNKILDIWLISVLDDGNYKNAGFYVNSDGASVGNTFKGKTSLSNSLTLVQNAKDGEGNITPVTLRITCKNYNMKSGPILATRATDLATAGKTFTMQAAWTTMDGVTVRNNGMTVSFNERNLNEEEEPTDPEDLLSWARSFDGNEKLYIDVSKGQGQGTDGWLGGNARIAFMFLKSSTEGEWGNSGFVYAQPTGDGSIYVVTVPAGSWDLFIIKKLNPTNSNDEWGSTGNIPFNPNLGADQFQSSSALNGAVNLIDYFTSDSGNSNFHVHWGHYPAIPS